MPILRPTGSKENKKEDIMNDFVKAAKAGGKSMTFFGVIAIILGILAMMMPG